MRADGGKRRGEHLEATVARDDELDELIEEIIIDAHGDEGYWSFLEAFEDEVSFPVAASLVGMLVVVTAIDFDLTTGTDPAVSRLVAAYRRWLGIT